MFTMKIQVLNTNKPIVIKTLSVDTLREAEILLVKEIKRRYGNQQVIVVSNGDLTYDVYEAFEPFVRVMIRSI